MRQQWHLGDGGLPFKLGSSSMFLLKELPSSLHTTVCGNDISFSVVDVLDEGLNLLVDKHDGCVAAMTNVGV
jgi:hypothetical protein